jgi:hypothetical protein
MFHCNCWKSILFCHELLIAECIDLQFLSLRSFYLIWFAGGRFFVIAIYLGLILSLISTFISINTFVANTAFFDENSPFYTSERVTVMRTMIFNTSTTQGG